MDAARLNQALRPLLLLTWAILWLLYWLTGRDTITGIGLLAAGVIISVILIGLSLRLWSRQPFELAEGS
ncbi:MAG TPA: hypothetical protein ENG31_00930 [Candidatus Thorarchaeota archaeon]|nr:MAG: hypothetical protein DRO73_01300 [Candidatus Thorarchaeota archaeon]RLI58700.1 MAG: hypothetical protein DRO93_09420 [Candidatus Thorarchaeota archaeon]HDD67168.1 hypothetical protein [Candidatus Thorarchaeota archaeon]